MQIAALLLAAVFAQAAPTVTTGGAESITTTSAAVTGTVNPGGVGTTVYFEYGTSDAYGLTTPQQDAGAGSEPVNVRATLSGLTDATTYHYRLVATPAGGEPVRGADRTLRTTARPAPQAPAISGRAATAVGGDGATLNAGVNPRGLATTVRFQYGTSTSYGSSTPEQPIGSGGSTVGVSAAIGGLRPGTRYNFRAVATSAAGVTRGPNRTFTTPRVPTGVAITPSTRRPVHGSGLRITGTIGGVASATTVALEKQDFPYGGGFTQVATARSNSRGAFTLDAPPLYVTARLRVVTRTSVVATSPVITASVAARVGLKTIRLRGKRTRIEGAIWPAIPNGRVSLQRRSSSGRWIYVKRARISPLSGGRSRYRFAAVPRYSRARTYRVVAIARDGGAHVPGTSRSVTIPRR